MNADLERIFEGFTDDIERIVVVPGGEQIPRRARERRRVAVSVASAGAAVAVAAAISIHAGIADEPDPGSTPVTRPSTPRGLGWSAIQGDWRTRPLSRGDVARALDAAGLGRYAASYVSHLPDHLFRIELRVRGGVLQVWEGSSLVDTEHFVLGARDLETHTLGSPGEEMSSHYTWRLRGPRLRLALVDTQVAPYNGYPADVTLRALFTVAPFVRHG